jgi:hypothetical protein
LVLAFLAPPRVPASLACQSLCLEALPVCMECFLSGLMLSDCPLGLDLAECLTCFSLRFGQWLVPQTRAVSLSFLHLRPELDPGGGVYELRLAGNSLSVERSRRISERFDSLRCPTSSPDGR